MPFLERETNLLLTGFTVLFFSGFLLANSILISASFIPLFIFLIEVFIAPLKVQVKKTGIPSSARLGEILEVRIEGKVTGGPGAVVIWDEVPKSFQLVEGSNYKVISKDFKEKVFSFSYKILCSKCGKYRLGLGWETKHVFGLVQTQFSMEKETKQLKVLPVLPKIRRIKLPVGRTEKIQPSGGTAKVGSSSTNFKEIRHYFYGDPFKIINWKASARAAGWGKSNPLVNEYEREGKLSTWLFLDANPDLMIGTTIENAVQCIILAAYMVSYYFLSKGYSLGMYVYNHRGETFHTDTGKKQFIKIADGLLKLVPPTVGLQVFWDEGFFQAVERNRKSLITQSPVIIIITQVTTSNWNDLLKGLRKILALRRTRGKPDICVINIIPYDLIPKADNWEVFAANMLEVINKDFSGQLRKLGLTVVDWNPKNESLEHTLLRTIRTR